MFYCYYFLDIVTNVILTVSDIELKTPEIYYKSVKVPTVLIKKIDDNMFYGKPITMKDHTNINTAEEFFTYISKTYL